MGRGRGGVWIKFNMALILVFHNDGTGDSITGPFNGIGNYNVQVLVGDGTPLGSNIIARGRVEGHARGDGWQKLVQLFLDKQL